MAAEPLDAIPLSALQHEAYCPRQCALIHVEQMFEDNLFTQRGQALHKRGDIAACDDFSWLRIATVDADLRAKIETAVGEVRQLLAADFLPPPLNDEHCHAAYRSREGNAAAGATASSRGGGLLRACLGLTALDASPAFSCWCGEWAVRRKIVLSFDGTI